MSRWVHVVLDSLLPRSCEVCAQPLAPGHPSCLCGVCVASMAPVPDPACTTCGVPVPAAQRVLPCSTCTRFPPRFTTARAATLYRPAAVGLNPLAAAIHRLKYDGRRALAGPLGVLLAERFPFGDHVVLVPVPLHPSRLRGRGFNQAVLLARELGKRRRLPMVVRALARTRATLPQTGLIASVRRRNPNGVFSVVRPLEVRGRHVVLIDDVLTTGATANACADALLAARVRRVDVYTVGRVP